MAGRRPLRGIHAALPRRRGRPHRAHGGARLYDTHNVYVGIDCEQIHSPIVRRLQRRDGFLPSDGVWIDIDSRNDGVSAYHFSINAAGALLDGIHYNDTGFSADWDAIWEAKVATTERGYSAEFRIPLSTLRFTALPVQSWGFQVRRFIDARQETDDWAFFPRSASSVVPYFGRLDDSAGLPAPGRFELRPFALGKLEHRAAGADASSLEHGTFTHLSAGLDAKAHLTNELTLDLTVNPDFGAGRRRHRHPEPVDLRDVLPQKRPFFLEGLDVFATIRPILYTRRIGRQPPLPTLSATEALYARPDPSAIYGAAKVSGTIGGKTTVGLMSAVTGENDTLVQTADGTRVSRLVDPPTAFNVLRVKRLIAANADVGLMATATNRFEPELPAGARCPTTQALPAPDGRCTNDAYVLSLDGRWRSESGDYAAAWQAIGSVLSRGPARSQPGRNPIVPGDTAGGISAYVGKEGGAHWLWNAWQHLTGRELEFNDLGYLERKNDYQGYFNLAYRTLQPWWMTRETTSGFQFNVRETLDGVRLWQGVALTTNWTLRNFWSLYFEVNLRGRYSDDREMGDGSALQFPASGGAIVSLSTDPRRRLTFAWSGVAELRESGYGAYLQTNAQLTLRIRPELELTLLPTAVFDDGLRRYVGTDASLVADWLTGRLPIRDPERHQRRDHGAGGLHLHSRALAAVLHAALSRLHSLQLVLRLSQDGVPRTGAVYVAHARRRTIRESRLRAGDVERQPGAALGVPSRLDVVLGLHAGADTGADSGARQQRTVRARADLARARVGRRPPAEARVLARLVFFQRLARDRT